MSQDKKQNKQLLDEAMNRLKKYSSFSRHNYKESLSGIYWRLAKVAQFLELEMEKDCEKYKYDPKKLKYDDEAAQDFDSAFSLVVDANSGFLIKGSAGNEYWRIRAAFLFVESMLIEIDGEESAKKIIEIHGARVTRKKDDSIVVGLKTPANHEPVTDAVIAYLDRNTHGAEFSTTKAALDALSAYKSDGESFPKSGKGLSEALKRLAPAFRQMGIRAETSKIRTSQGYPVIIKPLSDNYANSKKHNDTIMTYAVIGAMDVTGGDAEEAARLLGVTVEFIHERF